MLKRCFDFTCALFLLILASPTFLLCAILIKLDSKGPVLFRQLRMGRDFHPFALLKLRTMEDHSKGTAVTLGPDPRITHIGRWLRKYKLDELPQLWNVMRGDMSLVGPRPPISSEVAQYDMEHLRRLDAVPGITGLWQVEARQNPSFDSYVSLDRTYVNHWSLMLDLRILLRTFRAVIRGTGS